MENKILLEALLKPYNISLSKKKELAAIMNLPENSQSDLMFMAAILVSTGTNKNGATFLGSELIKARNSISQKPLDIEHEEDKIIGHIASSVYMDFDGNLINDENLYNELSKENSNKEESKKVISKLDSLNMDIGIVCAVYKDRFPQLSSEIENGDWKVSMECYYEDYDLKIGKLIFPKTHVEEIRNANAELTEELYKVTTGNSLGTPNVSRILREIRFCGVGIVKNPANERSIIIEAASQNNMNDNLVEAANNKEIKINKNNIIAQIPSQKYIIVDKLGNHIKIFNMNSNYEDVVEEAVKLSLDTNEQYNIIEVNDIIKPVTNEELMNKLINYTKDEKGNIIKNIPFKKNIEQTSEVITMKDEAQLEVKEGIDVPENIESLNVTIPEPTPLNLNEFAEIPLHEIVDILWGQIYSRPLVVNVDQLRNETYYDPVDNRRHFREVSFGLPEKALFLLDSKENVKNAVTAFSYLVNKVTEEDKNILFNNILKASTIYNVDTEEFEKIMSKNGLVRSNEDYNLTFAIPRLELLPLSTREQVIAAMSRCPHVKVDLTDREKEFMVINILRAANKFNIETKSFKERVKKLGL